MNSYGFEGGAIVTELEWLQLFGENLKRKLKYARMSQKELSDATGISESAISNYINGRQLPTVRSVLNICYELVFDTDELIDFGSTIE